MPEGGVPRCPVCRRPHDIPVIVKAPERPKIYEEDFINAADLQEEYDFIAATRLQFEELMRAGYF